MPDGDGPWPGVIVIHDIVGMSTDLKNHKHGFSVSAPNYGAVPGDVDALLSGACPIVASFGGKDRSLRGAAEKLKHALIMNGVSNDVKEYPEAGHGFLNDHAADDLSVVMRVMFELVGVGYHEPSAQDARSRILAFFGAHLN